MTARQKVIMLVGCLLNAALTASGRTSAVSEAVAWSLLMLVIAITPVAEDRK